MLRETQALVGRHRQEREALVGELRLLEAAPKVAPSTALEGACGGSLDAALAASPLLPDGAAAGVEAAAAELDEIKVALSYDAQEGVELMTAEESRVGDACKRTALRVAGGALPEQQQQQQQQRPAPLHAAHDGAHETREEYARPMPRPVAREGSLGSMGGLLRGVSVRGLLGSITGKTDGKGGSPTDRSAAPSERHRSTSPKRRSPSHKGGAPSKRDGTPDMRYAANRLGAGTGADSNLGKAELASSVGAELGAEPEQPSSPSRWYSEFKRWATSSHSAKSSTMSQPASPEAKPAAPLAAWPAADEGRI